MLPKAEEKEDLDVNMELAQPSNEKEGLPATNGKEAEQEQQQGQEREREQTQEKPMELATPPVERITPTDVPMEIEESNEVLATSKETVEETPLQTMATESSTAAKDANDSKPAVLPTVPGASDEPQSVSNQVNDNKKSDDASIPNDSTKDATHALAVVQAPVDSKPSKSPPETRPRPLEPKYAPVAAPKATKFVAKPPEPSPADEKEEGELSEDG